MKVAYSEFLSNSKHLAKRLIDMLSESYEYVSILGTDTKGKSLRVSKRETEVRDYPLVERGFVVRIYNGTNYSEYSFNQISEDKLPSIVEDIKSKLSKVSKGITSTSYTAFKEDTVKGCFIGEVEIDPEDISPEVIIKSLTEIKDAALDYSDLIVDFNAVYNYIHVSKMFLSREKDLEQSYMLGDGRLYSLTRRDSKTKFYYIPFSGLKGYELVDELKNAYKEVVDMSVKLLDAKTAVPGEYDIICSPEISGLIAHEAFGHGVEMDMFVKGRAKGAEYMNKQVASCITTMHDGAAAAKHMSSYFFDDEGTLGTDTVVIENGILKSGISDLLSAVKLGTVPTGNGKRQSFERKAYARMTNTFFGPGNDKLEDMVGSIKRGYLLESVLSGMEDPKNWGIQCIALLGREIIDGKLTGDFISPVIITGYVPDLLNSISMVSEVVKLDGAGFCGKGYKEIVKVSDGGPYIKAKARLA